MKKEEYKILSSRSLEPINSTTFQRRSQHDLSEPNIAHAMGPSLVHHYREYHILSGARMSFLLWYFPFSMTFPWLLTFLKIFMTSPSLEIGHSNFMTFSRFSMTAWTLEMKSVFSDNSLLVQKLYMSVLRMNMTFPLINMMMMICMWYKSMSNYLTYNRTFFKACIINSDSLDRIAKKLGVVNLWE